MRQWTGETERIINANNMTLNVSNYAAEIQKRGGFDAYIKSLGGVFREWHGVTTPPETEQEMQERLEYVLGCFAIFGADYNNGYPEIKGRHYYRWGCGSGTAPAKDAFRKTGLGKCAGGTLGKVLGTPSIVTTNCNYGLDTALRAMGLYKCATVNYEKWVSQYGAKYITSKAQLRTGDMVHFFNSSGTWVHVAIVFAVEGGQIWLADFGSRFIKTKKPLHSMPVDDKKDAGGEYSGRTWKAIRAFTLRREEIMTEQDYAVQLKRIVCGQLEEPTEICRLASKYMMNGDDYLRAAASFVLKGFAGKGEAREKYFGADYPTVQAKVNEVISKAKDVLDGKYGNGPERVKRLGADYDVVQEQVNRMIREGRA